MNKITGEITEIVSLERINLVKFKIKKQQINVLMLEMNLDLNVGKKAELIVKPTAVSVSNEMCDFENALKGEIISVVEGEILMNVTVNVEGFEIESVMLKGKKLQKEVYVLFKANDVAISKVL